MQLRMIYRQARASRFIKEMLDEVADGINGEES